MLSSTSAALKELSRQLDDARIEVQLQRNVRELAISPELIVSTPLQWTALDAARLRLFKEAGYPPTQRYDIVLHHADLSGSFDPPQPMDPVPTTIPGNGLGVGVGIPYSQMVMANDGPDYFLVGAAINACGQIADSNHVYEDYFRRNPKLFDTHIRPLLLR